MVPFPSVLLISSTSLLISLTYSSFWVSLHSLYFFLGSFLSFTCSLPRFYSSPFLVFAPYSFCRFGAEILWVELELFLLVLPCSRVQLHHVPTPSVVKSGRHSGSAVQVFPACAGDYHPSAEEGTLGSDFLVESVQVLGCWGESLC